MIIVDQAWNHQIIKEDLGFSKDAGLKKKEKGSVFGLKPEHRI
jgi:hypothetical protein